VTDETVEQFWSRFVAATGIDGPYTAWGFGNTERMMTELALLVRDGPKRATASLPSEYGPDEPFPQAGDLSVILDGRGEPVCVIRTTHVEVRRFGDVDADFAWTEGEGDRTLEDWRQGHLDYFAAEGTPIDDESEIVLERFELLWP
jgi:uncharacterized protein YhfF